MSLVSLVYTDPCCRKDGLPLVRTLGPIPGSQVQARKTALFAAGCKDFKIKPFTSKEKS